MAAVRFWMSRRLGPYSVGMAWSPREGRHAHDGQRLPFSASTRSGYVYVVEGTHGQVKIGHSRDPKGRLRDLQTGSPFHLRIAHTLFVAGDASAVEAEAHATLERRRMLGEWFAVTPDVAVAAVYGAAVRLGEVGTSSAPALSSLAWLRRTFIMATLYTPAWLAASIRQEAAALPLFALASVLAVAYVVWSGDDGQIAWRSGLAWAGCLVMAVLASASASAFVSVLWS